MKTPPLAPRELDLISDVFRRHPEISSVILFGSRAKGTHLSQSDIDLAFSGDLDPLRAEAIAGELDELPLPYRFEVQILDLITNPGLRDHIHRVGIELFSNTPEAEPLG